MTRGIEIYFCEFCNKRMSRVERGFANNGLCSSCDADRKDSYKDKAEIIAMLEGEKKSYAMDNTLQEYNEGHNQALDTAIEKIKEM